MNKNKGIIGLGLILAVVLGVVVVGGGAYYLGKSNGRSKEVKISNNIVPQENQDTKNESINTEVKNTISMVLPEPYISSNNWPPIINRYPSVYSCEPLSSKDSGEISTVVEQITINGKKYCRHNQSSYEMNHWTNRYMYILANGNDTRIMSINLVKANCDVYGSSLNGGDIEYKKCQIAQSNFNLDKIVDNLFAIDSKITIPSCSANGITVTFPKNDFECYYDNANSLNISYSRSIKMSIFKFNDQSSFKESLPYGPEYESINMDYIVNAMPAQYYKNFYSEGGGGSTIVIPSKLVKIHLPVTITETTQSIYDQIISSIEIK